MNMNIKRAPSSVVQKESSIKRNFLNPIRNLLRNPLGYFVILGVVLCLLGYLAQKKVIPYSLSTSLTKVTIYAIISIGFCLLLGYSGLASLGTAGFIGIGALAGYIAMQKWPLIFTVAGIQINFSFFIALGLTIILALVIGAFVGFISLIIEGMYLAILTLGLAEILFKVLENISALLTGSATINISTKYQFFVYAQKLGLDKWDKSTKCMIVAVIFVALLMLTQNLINSPTGRAMLTMKNSTSAAQAMGISLIKYRLLAFVISTIYAAIGGLLYLSCVTGSLNTSDSALLTLSTSLNILGAIIIGGSKSLWGTIVGVVIVFGLQELIFNNIPMVKEFFQKNPAFMSIISGLLIVVIVMFYPGGLSQLFLELKFKIKKLIKKMKEKKYGSY